MDPLCLASKQHQQHQPRSNGSSAAARRGRKTFVVEPTPERQIIYNRLWEEAARQQHSQSPQWLSPPTQRSTPPSRAPSSGGTSPTGAASGLSPRTGDPSRRPRGRRGGPLNTDVRFKSALRRALKLVCADCRSRRVACECYDVSRLEEARAASHGPSTSAGAPRSGSRASSRVRSSPWHTEPDLVGLGSSDPATSTPIYPNIPDLEWDQLSGRAQPPNTRPDVQRYALQFDPNTLLPGAHLAPAKPMAYNPVLGNSVEDGMVWPSAGFPVGSEIAEDTGLWRCEFVAGSETCSWTGPVAELSQHWKASHHPIRQTEPWCECIRCWRLLMGWDKPYRCLDEACSPTGAVWRRWLYGHTLVESTVASTPILTQSGESENGSFDLGGSWNMMQPGSQEGSFSQADPFSNGSFSGHQHCSGYQKESHSAEGSGGESSEHAHGQSAGSPHGRSASKSQSPSVSKDTSHAAHAPQPPRMSSGFLGCSAPHPPTSWAKKMPQIFCTLAASGVATAILEPRCFLGANIIYVARALSPALTTPWIFFFLICCGFAVAWLVQACWSAAPYYQGSLHMQNAVLRRVPVTQRDSGP